jgi:hypothetical protein
MTIAWEATPSQATRRYTMAMETMHVNVDARRKAPTNTGLTFKEGAEITIVSEGRARYSEDARMHGPRGAIPSFMRADAPAPRIPIGSLLAKIGDFYIQVGPTFTGNVPQGELGFVYNDRPGMYRDNDGHFSVTIVFNGDDVISRTWPSA